MKSDLDLGAFGLDMINDMLVIPGLLLRSYARLGMTELHVMVLINLMYRRQALGQMMPAPEMLQAEMSVGVEGVRGAIAELIELGLLGIESVVVPNSMGPQNCYHWRGLFQRVAELWFDEKGTSYSEPSKKTDLPDEGVTSAVRAFEAEFGRMLSPMEVEQITSWFSREGFGLEMVMEALKRSVMRGVVNLRYVDSILRQWARNNVRTPQDITVYEERFLAGRSAVRGQSPVKRGPQAKKDKYRDIYMS